jgi:hypothetical protein
MCRVGEDRSAGRNHSRGLGHTLTIDHVRGPNKRHRRLGADIERIIDAAIQTHYLVRPRKPMESVYKEVHRRCHAEKRVTPSRNSVLKRIRTLDARLVARKRLGAKSAEYRVVDARHARSQ